MIMHWMVQFEYSWVFVDNAEPVSYLFTFVKLLLVPNVKQQCIGVSVFVHVSDWIKLAVVTRYHRSDLRTSLGRAL